MSAGPEPPADGPAYHTIEADLAALRTEEEAFRRHRDAVSARVRSALASPPDPGPAEDVVPTNPTPPGPPLPPGTVAVSPGTFFLGLLLAAMLAVQGGNLALQAKQEREVSKALASIVASLGGSTPPNPPSPDPNPKPPDPPNPPAPAGDVDAGIRAAAAAWLAGYLSDYRADASQVAATKVDYNTVMTAMEQSHATRQAAVGKAIDAVMLPLLDPSNNFTSSSAGSAGFTKVADSLQAGFQDALQSASKKGAR
jgi:hypothetical protein